MDRSTVIIIDDHPLFREGLKAVLQKSPRFEIIGEAGDGAAGYKLATELQPDITITNISMPGMDGIELTRRLKENLPGTKVVILSRHTGINHISLAMQAGAAGYLAKDSTADSVIAGINAVADNQAFEEINISQAIPKEVMGIKVLEHYRIEQSFDNLTPREQQVMSGLVQEKSYQELAAEFSISTKTLENHRSNIMRKLGLKREIELIRFAAQIGLTDSNA